MKRHVLRFATLAIIFCLSLQLVACGGGTSGSTAPGKSGTTAGSNPKDGITLSIAFNVETSDEEYERDLVPLFNKFMELHPEVTEITLTGMGKVSEDQQVTRLTGSKYEDILLIPMSIPAKELPNYFAPVGDAKQLGEKYFYGDYLQVDGQSYGLPIGVVYEGLLYNQAVLDECYGGKVPQTLDELWEACNAIDQADKICFYTNAGAQWPLRFWDNLAITASEDPGYANTILEKTAPWAEGEPLRFSGDLLAQLAAKGMIEPDTITEQWDNSRISLATGDSAFMLIGTWALPQVKKIAQEMGADPEMIRFAPFPYKNDVSPTNKLQVRVSEDLFMGVNKNSEHPELAQEFLVFFCENVSLSRGMNEIMRDGGQNVEDLMFLQDLDYVEFYSSPAKSPEIAEVASAAKIDVFSVGGYLQEYVIQPSLNGEKAKFDELNTLWAAELKK